MYIVFLFIIHSSFVVVVDISDRKKPETDPFELTIYYLPFVLLNFHYMTAKIILARLQKKYPV